MCVIFACSKTRPTPEQVAAGYAANPRGAGIAWREELDGETVVMWKKGMNLEEAQKMVANVPLPFVIHFRIPSVGPDKPQYNHPFPISPNAELDLEGVTTGNVLFHNGTWHSWRHDARKLAHDYGVQIPLHDWSDSRAMAFAAYCAGLGELSFIDERVVVFGPDLMEVFSPKSWSRVAEGFWASNNGWSYAQKTSYTGSNNAQKSAEVLLPDVENEQAGGAASVTNFPDDDLQDVVDGSMAKIFGGGDQQAGVQSSEEILHAAVERPVLDPEVIEQTQKGFRAWIAQLQPKIFSRSVH